MSTPPLIRLAKSDDVQNIAALQRLESNRVGFVPFGALVMYIEKGWVHVAEDRTTALIAYILGRPSLRYARWSCPITQLVVHPDHRRQRIASLLVHRRATEATNAGLDCVQAWTREDLPANRLWEALGFDLIAERKPATARKRSALLWRLPLTAVGHERMREIPPAGGWKGKLQDGQMILPLARNGPPCIIV
jgi:ribosomal protein S18 acetylase RimI-like enzyme